VTVVAQRNDDGSYTGGVGQRLRFGGEPWRVGRPEERVRVSRVEFVGGSPIAEAELRRGFGVESGDRVTRSGLLDASDGLRERLIEAGYIEAEVGARLVEGQALVDVSAGPQVSWRVVGAAKPGGFDQALRASLSVESALETGRDLLLAHVHQSGRLRAEVTASDRDEDGRRVLVFEVRPGSVLDARVEFPGASGLSREELLAAAGGPAALLSAPEAAAARLREAYGKALFLAAEVDNPRILENGSQLSITVPIREGTRARVREVHVRGSTLPDAVARRSLRLRAGREYDGEAPRPRPPG
jgi:outer membrane protein assembly factor BamA